MNQRHDSSSNPSVWTACARTAIPVWLLVLVLAGASPAAGEPPAETPGLGARTVPQYKVKAAYLLRFVRYVNWPDTAFASPDAPIEIGVLGRNPFEGALESMVVGLQTQSRPIRVRQLSGIKEARQCHAVFIGRGQEREEAAWLAELKTLPVLTVTDSPEGIARGAVISLYVEDSRVVFAASMPAARAAGLRLSASMLTSARKVVRGDAKPEEDDS